MNAAKGLLALAASLVIQPAGAETYRIGMSYPATGPQSFLGVTWANGAELAIRDASGDGKSFELVKSDDQGDARQGTLVAQRFCDDPSILGVIANFSSGVTLPTSDVYNRCGLAQVTNASSLKVTQNGYRNLFRPIGNDAAQGSVPATYAAKELKARKAAILHDKSAYGQGLAEIFRDTFVKEGGQVGSFQGVSPTDVDFSAVLTTLRTERPDVVFFGGMMPPAALIPKQMSALGIKARYISGDPIHSPDFAKIAGPAAAGALASTQAPPYDSSDRLKDFARRYKDAFGSEPGPYSVYGYNMAKLIIDAINRSGKPSRDSVIAELRKTDADSLTGRIRFTETGELTEALMFLYEFRNGAFHEAWPKL